jgi:hypothetical protein
MYPKLTTAEVKSLYPEFADGQDYVGSQVKYLWDCPVHGQYSQHFGNHRDKGCGCPACARQSGGKKRRLRISDIKALFPDFVDGQEYTNNSAKYRWNCPEHGEYLQEYCSHRAGRGCPRCAHARSTVPELTADIVKARFPRFLDGQIYIDQTTRYKWLCPVHGVYVQTYVNHQQGKNCAKCMYDKKRLTLDEIKSRFPEFADGQKYTNASAKYFFDCQKHGPYEQSFTSHQGGSRCPQCRHSRGERRIAKLLDAKKVPWKAQAKFPGCRDKLPLVFDFALLDLRILIEYQGEQHYRPLGWQKAPGKEAERLKSLQRRDRIKAEWAEANGYALIKIPYNVKDVESYLQTFLGKLGVKLSQKPRKHRGPVKIQANAELNLSHLREFKGEGQVPLNLMEPLFQCAAGL